jgi:hypothetical protein
MNLPERHRRTYRPRRKRAIARRLVSDKRVILTSRIRIALIEYNMRATLPSCVLLRDDHHIAFSNRSPTRIVKREMDDPAVESRTTTTTDLGRAEPGPQPPRPSSTSTRGFRYKDNPSRGQSSFKSCGYRHGDCGKDPPAPTTRVSSPNIIAVLLLTLR